MPFNGSGVFSRVYNWVTDKNNSIDITASRMDTEDSGFATGLSRCLLKDGTQIVTANIPMANFKFTGLGNGSVSTDSLAYGQVLSSSTALATGILTSSLVNFGGSASGTWNFVKSNSGGGAYAQVTNSNTANGTYAGFEAATGTSNAYSQFLQQDGSALNLLIFSGSGNSGGIVIESAAGGIVVEPHNGIFNVIGVTATAICQSIEQTGIQQWNVGMSASNGTLKWDPTNTNISTPVMALDTSGNITLATWAGTTIAVNKGGTGVTACNPILQRVSTETGAVATGTTTTPDDDTIPQITEGDQYMSLAITPLSATSKLVIEVRTNFAISAGVTGTVALFQDSTANALAACRIGQTSTAGRGCQGTLTHIMTSGTTSATTFKVRIGADSSATTTFNGTAGGRIYGGVMASSISITEYTS